MDNILMIVFNFALLFNSSEFVTTHKYLFGICNWIVKISMPNKATACAKTVAMWKNIIFCSLLHVTAYILRFDLIIENSKKKYNNNFKADR